MSLVSFVSGHKDSWDDFQVVFADHFDESGDHLQLKSWRELMRAFEAGGISMSEAAARAMCFAPVEHCEETEYTYYFRCLAGGKNVKNRHKIAIKELLQKAESNETVKGKVLGGVFRWCSLDNLEQALSRRLTLEEEEKYAANILYWGSDNDSLQSYLGQKRASMITKEVMEQLFDKMTRSILSTKKASTVDWNEVKDKAELEAMLWEAFKRDRRVLECLLNYSHRFRDLRDDMQFLYAPCETVFLKTVYLHFALPVMEILVDRKYKFLDHDGIVEVYPHPSLLERMRWEMVETLSRRYARNNAELRRHARTLREVSKSLASLLK